MARQGTDAEFSESQTPPYLALGQRWQQYPLKAQEEHSPHSSSTYDFMFAEKEKLRFADI
ncbi:hypothetical protein DBR06_SOUSAS4210156, partial [Sousa chinensis]